MKIRRDFVTNSSSSSYIICFARIANEEKAKKIIEEHHIRTLDSKDVKGKMYYGELGADWCGAIIYGANDVLSKHPDGKYIIIEDSNDGMWDEEYDDYIYDYDFAMNYVIDEITEENGFADVECAEGEGYNG